MLVLSRREGEKIRIGEDIVITVVRVSGDKVRIGVEAPRNTLILRNELRTRQENGWVDERACTECPPVNLTPQFAACSLEAGTVPMILSNR
ncbi:MAG: carbon storage regulator [Planctomycetaceae bacterium]|jgi:carbon storage regulator|nr:carbon storage regulator [Planctomycetaceae bacterium]